jgi:hypothetical protein
MKFLILIGLCLSSTFALANDNCGEEIQNSLVVVLQNQFDLRDGKLNFEAALNALETETDTHVATVRACKVAGPEERYAFCSNVPKLLIVRNDIIKKSELFSKKEKNKLSFLNQHNQELARIVCP